MEYKDLGLVRTVLKDSFDWAGKKISFYKYLPIESKYDIVMITLQESFEDGIYNPIKLDMNFHVNLVFMYTDLVFTEEERSDIGKLYDEMKSTGFLDEFLRHINPDEYKEMQEDIDDIAELSMTYKTTAASVFSKFVDDLPTNAEAAQKIVENFDANKYKEVVEFAKAANGGRPIPAVK